MLNKTLLAFVLFISASGWANEYSYQADVNGMVCAFCAYNVSKNVSSLPGVNADSVDIDLKAGQVKFYSSQLVSEKQLAAIFADSGFTLSNLRKSELNKTPMKQKDAKSALVVEFDGEKTGQYENLLEAIGNIVASTSSSLLIKAPKAYEEALLKPILMGRQQVIKVRFIPVEFAMIRLQLFEE